MNETDLPTSPENEASAPADAAEPVPILDEIERRVLGVLIEKSKTTPDVYPMSLNALVTGCNQKSNRHPVMSLSDAEVETALHRLKQRNLVEQIFGSGRVDKYRHLLYDRLQVDRVQLAIIGELLLRGHQTVGELRARAARMEPIPDLDSLRGHLHALAERKLVLFLTPEQRRGGVVTHAFYTAEELERIRASAGREGHAEVAPARAPANPALADRVARLEQEIADIRQALQELRRALQPPEASSA